MTDSLKIHAIGRDDTTHKPSFQKSFKKFKIELGGLLNGSVPVPNQYSHYTANNGKTSHEASALD